MARAKKISVFVLISVFIFLSSALLAATVPTYEFLTPLKTGVRSFPYSVSVDAVGTIYVAQTAPNRVSVYDRHGNYLRGVSLEQPIAINVDTPGTVYIAQKTQVGIYDALLRPVGVLGNGQGEFYKVTSLAVDSAGNVYVLDTRASKIKVYTADGQFLSSFGAYGYEPGQLYGPTAITIDRLTDELYVLDKGGVFYDQDGTTRIAGSRVQILDLNGVQIKEFDISSTAPRSLGIAVDGQGRVYVTDSLFSIVQVYDTDGNNLETITGPVETGLITPTHLSYQGKRLYAASNFGEKVWIVGLDDYGDMGVSPQSLSFTAQKLNPGSPAPQAITISNSGTGAINCTVTTADPWVVVSQDSVVVGANAEAAVDITVNAGGLEVGQYTGEVVVETDGASESVSIALQVDPPAVLGVTPASLSFVAEGKDIPPPQNIEIELSGDSVGGMSWTAAADATWIQLGQTGGPSNTFTLVPVSVDIAGMKKGSYTGVITVSADGATGSPAEVSVTLDIVTKNTLTVTTNLSAATFEVSPDSAVTGAAVAVAAVSSSLASYSGGGTEWTIEDIPPGTYTITFGNVGGYITPAPQTVTIDESGTVVITVQYKKNRHIIIGTGPGPQNDATITIVDAGGMPVKDITVFEGTKYGVNVAAGDIDGDGWDEIIAAPGPGPENSASVAVLKADGTRLTADITALGSLYGARVATADIDRDGRDEIIVGAGPDPETDARVRVYTYNGEALVETGIDFIAFFSAYGVNVAAGDIDGDGSVEIITGAGPDPEVIAKVLIWELSAAEGMGSWKVISHSPMNTPFDAKYGAQVAVADLNGDDTADILVGSGAGGGMVKAYDGNGAEMGLEIIIGSKPGKSGDKYPVEMAAGDLGADKKVDIAVGPGASPQSPAEITLFDTSGQERGRVTAFDNMKYGATVAIGSLGY